MSYQRSKTGFVDDIANDPSKAWYVTEAGSAARYFNHIPTLQDLYAHLAMLALPPKARAHAGYYVLELDSVFYAGKQCIMYEWKSLYAALRRGAGQAAPWSPRGMCLAQDAGFEVRDVVCWLRERWKMELWGLLMKPRAGTYVQNIKQHAAGGINIRATRIPTRRVSGGAYSKNAQHHSAGWRMHQGGASDYTQPDGRWPTNLIITAPAFPEGSVTGKRSPESRAAIVKNTQWGTDNHQSKEYPNESGSTARYFHCLSTHAALYKYLLRMLKTP